MVMAQLVLQLRHVLHDPQAAALAVSALALLIVCPLLALLIFGIDGRRTPSSTAAAAKAAREKLLLSKLPSPPSRLPVIGHLHLVGSLPHVSLRDIAAQHDRDGLMLLRLGAVPTLVVSSPSAARTVLRTHDHVFASRGSSSITDVLFYGSTDVGFSPYGEHWRQVKKIVTTHLLSNRKVRSYRHAREEEVRLVVSKIREAAAAGTTAVDLSELLISFTNDIVCRAVSGKFFREEGRNKLFREIVNATALLIGGFNVEDYFPALVKMGIVKRMVCVKARKVWKRMDDLLEKIIDDHASSKPAAERDGAGEESDDFIDVLLSVQQEYNLTRDHIKAQLSIMFGAGTDTSSVVLEYAMVRLMQHPHVMNKLQAEVRGATMPKGKDQMVTEDELTNLAYLKAVIKETLRLHMPAPLFVPHLSMADCDIEGYTIPAGTRTIVNGWALARDPKYWESAEEFMPERFMEGGSAAAMDYKGTGDDFLFLPFGAGRRMCPGMNFAMSTVEVMLANLVYHFDWELPLELREKGIDMTESFGLVVHRSKELLLVPLVPPQE